MQQSLKEPLAAMPTVTTETIIITEFDLSLGMEISNVSLHSVKQYVITWGQLILSIEFFHLSLSSDLRYGDLDLYQRLKTIRTEGQ